MEVLIVSKTKMGLKYCVGGIEFPSFRCIRLLNADGSYQPGNTEFNVGDFWDVEFIEAPKIIPPHVEDVLIQSKKRLNKTFSDYNWLIKQREMQERVWYGAPQKMFEKALQWTGSRRGFISKNGHVPNVSTGFWIPDQDLTYNGGYYKYISSQGFIKQSYELKYVGTAIPIEVVPAKTVTRVSLAKWWAPDDVEIETRCYLQLSGWY